MQQIFNAWHINLELTDCGQEKLLEIKINIDLFVLQGWTKFYEFAFGDLRAGADIIDRLCTAAGK